MNSRIQAKKVPCQIQMNRYEPRCWKEKKIARRLSSEAQIAIPRVCCDAELIVKVVDLFM